MIKTCVICGKDFETVNPRRICCSPACTKLKTRRRQAVYRQYTRKGVKPPPVVRPKPKLCPAICLSCGKSFVQSFPNEKFCSDDCRLAFFNLDMADALAKFFGGLSP